MHLYALPDVSSPVNGRFQLPETAAAAACPPAIYAYINAQADTLPFCRLPEALGLD